MDKDIEESDICVGVSKCKLDYGVECVEMFEEPEEAISRLPVQRIKIKIPLMNRLKRLRRYVPNKAPSFLIPFLVPIETV